MVIDSKVVRRAAPLLALVAAASTGTLLASDPCKVFFVQKLTGAARTAEQHTAPAHQHTKATLAAWEKWGKIYLAEHGHPYVPPKRSVAKLNPGWQKQQEDALKFACELPKVPTVEKPFTTMLIPEETPFAPNLPVLTSELKYPPATDVPPGTPDIPGTPDSPDTPGGTGTPVGDSIPPPPPYINEPIFFPPPRGSDSTPPPVDTPPVDTPPEVPEPGSFILLATGIAAMLGVRRSGRRYEP